MILSRCHRADVHAQDCSCGAYYICSTCFKPCGTISVLSLITEDESHDDSTGHANTASQAINLA